jgi:CheY-like chemotaxis protein
MTEPCVLVVDDDEDIRGFVAAALQMNHNTVVEALDGQHALQLLATQCVDLILLDMKMPGMDGWSFALEYRARPGPHAPIVVMTAAADGPDRAQEVHAAESLAKPFEIDTLFQVLERCLRASARPE